MAKGSAAAKSSAADGAAASKAGTKKGAARKRAARTSKASETEDAGDLSFEGALEQLEATVGRLEAGEMPLEEALVLFEKGVHLSRQCTTTLEAAEKRIEMLVADRDDGATEPFDTEDLDDEDWDDEDLDDGDDAAEA